MPFCQGLEILNVYFVQVIEPVLRQRDKGREVKMEIKKQKNYFSLVKMKELRGKMGFTQQVLGECGAVLS